LQSRLWEQTMRKLEGVHPGIPQGLQERDGCGLPWMKLDLGVVTAGVRTMSCARPLGAFDHR
jgi:hypothetical protein